MKVIDYSKKSSEPLILVLGFFDCLHIGHLKLIERAEKIARETNCKACLFTFENADLSDGGSVLSFSERVEKAGRYGVNIVLKANFDERFKTTSPEDFLAKLYSTLDIKGIVCGYDYTFGFKAEGKVDTLAKFCKERNIPLEIVEKQEFNGVRISTTHIKSLLKEGKIEEANEILGEPYFIDGVVEKGRQVGRTLGFPTANTNIDKGKFRIKDGVYKTLVSADGKEYEGITNYGARPTFGLTSVTVETYLKNFDGNLYGKKITVKFLAYIRDIMKFSDKNELVKQLEKDKGSQLKPH